MAVEEVPWPQPRLGHEVWHAALCPTDLRIVEQDLLRLHLRIISGHLIVGEVVGSPRVVGRRLVRRRSVLKVEEDGRMRPRGLTRT